MPPPFCPKNISSGYFLLNYFSSIWISDDFSITLPEIKDKGVLSERRKLRLYP